MGEIMRAQTLLERWIPSPVELGEPRTGRMATTPGPDDPGAGGARARILFPYSGSLSGYSKLHKRTMSETR